MACRCLTDSASRAYLVSLAAKGSLILPHRKDPCMRRLFALLFIVLSPLLVHAQATWTVVSLPEDPQQLPIFLARDPGEHAVYGVLQDRAHRLWPLPQVD